MDEMLPDQQTACVVVNAVKSTYRECVAGIPQGCILGPILISTTFHKHTKMQMYEEDAATYTSAKNTQEAGRILPSAMALVQDLFPTHVCMMFSKQNKKTRGGSCDHDSSLAEVFLPPVQDITKKRVIFATEV